MDGDRSFVKEQPVCVIRRESRLRGGWCFNSSLNKTHGSFSSVINTIDVSFSLDNLKNRETFYLVLVWVSVRELHRRKKTCVRLSPFHFLLPSSCVVLLERVNTRVSVYCLPLRTLHNGNDDQYWKVKSFERSSIPTPSLLSPLSYFLFHSPPLCLHPSPHPIKLPSSSGRSSLLLIPLDSQPCKNHYSIGNEACLY